MDILLTAEQVVLSPRTRLLIEDQRAEWRELDRRIAAFDAQFARAVGTDATAQLLTTTSGIGTQCDRIGSRGWPRPDIRTLVGISLHGWAWCQGS